MDGLRIVSDGTVEGTNVYLDDSKVLNVTEVSWHFSPKQGKTFVTMEISNVAIEVSSPVQEAARENITAAMMRVATAG